MGRRLLSQEGVLPGVCESHHMIALGSPVVPTPGPEGHQKGHVSACCPLGLGLLPWHRSYLRLSSTLVPTGLDHGALCGTSDVSRGLGALPVSPPFASLHLW